LSNGIIVWLTGLSASGKSTIATAVAAELRSRQIPTVVLDGDVLRKTVSPELGFSHADRDENVRRVGGIAQVLAEQGLVVLVALISPYRGARDRVRAQAAHFIEVFINAPLNVCEARDPKGYYHLARSGQVRSFTGVSDDYEAPLSAEVECHTDLEDIETSVRRVLQAIERKLEAAGAQFG